MTQVFAVLLICFSTSGLPICKIESRVVANSAACHEFNREVVDKVKLEQGPGVEVGGRGFCIPIRRGMKS